MGVPNTSENSNKKNNNNFLVDDKNVRPPAKCCCWPEYCSCESSALDDLVNNNQPPHHLYVNPETKTTTKETLVIFDDFFNNNHTLFQSYFTAESRVVVADAATIKRKPQTGREPSSKKRSKTPATPRKGAGSRGGRRDLEDDPLMRRPRRQLKGDSPKKKRKK